MARLTDLPLELLHSIFRDILDELWGGVLTKQFLEIRRVCRKLNLCIEQEVLCFPLDPWDWGLRYGIMRMQFLHQVQNRDTASGKKMVLAISNAVDYAVKAKCKEDIAAKDTIALTRAQYSLAITGLLIRGVDMHYADFVAGRIHNRLSRARYQVTCSQSEAHALAVLAAANEGDVPMLELLLSQACFDPAPALAGAVLGPLSLAIRAQHIDAVRFLIKRWDYHGDIDCPDAAGAEGEHPIHLATRTGKLAFVELFSTRIGYQNLNAVTQTLSGVGMTPLDVAVAAGDVELVKFFVASPYTCKTGWGGMSGRKNTICYAVQQQRMEIIGLLLEQPETIITTWDPEDSPLAVAAALGRLDIVEHLESKGGVANKEHLVRIYHRCLSTSIEKCDVAMFDYFFAKEEMLPLKPMIDDDTSLLAAAVNDKEPYMFDKLVVREEFQTYHRRQAFMRALSVGNLEIAQRLIDSGEVDLWTPPYYAGNAAAYVKGRQEVFEFLKRHRVISADAQIGDYP